MTNAEYHEHPAVSKSDLDLINRSPLHYISAKKQPKEQTEALLFGSAVHKKVLEPEDFDNEFAVAPECDRRTAKGKSEWKEFLESAGNKGILSAELYAKVLNVSNAVAENPIVQKLLKGGKAEQSYFWNECGVECKCRPDYIKNDILIDLKTTQNASPEAFTKSAFDYRYHVQAWWYLHGLQQCGIDVKNFIFIAVEKTPPYAVCVYAADDLMLELGKMQALENLRTYAECLNSGEWFGYEKEPQLHSLSLPDWIIKKYF
jgi:exodeoxyribonuclease VIII